MTIRELFFGKNRQKKKKMKKEGDIHYRILQLQNGKYIIEKGVWYRLIGVQWWNCYWGRWGVFFPEPFFVKPYEKEFQEFSTREECMDIIQELQRYDKKIEEQKEKEKGRLNIAKTVYSTNDTPQ